MAVHPMLSRFLERMQRQAKERVWQEQAVMPEDDFFESDWHTKDFQLLLREAHEHIGVMDAERDEMLHAVRAKRLGGGTLTDAREKLYREQIAYHCAEAALRLAMIADNAEMGRSLIPAEARPATAEEVTADAS